MNRNSKVFQFVVISTGIYLAFSLVLSICNISNPYLQNINLFSSIHKKEQETKEKKEESEELVGPNKPDGQAISTNFLLYHKANYLTCFQADTSQPSLPVFFQKLYEQKSGKQKRKIRIAYFGDSMIEGDLMTSTFRDSMQKMFGGSGVGFVQVKSIVSGFRMTARTSTTGSWSEVHFKNSSEKNLYLSGYAFKSGQAGFTCTNNVVNDSLALIEKSLLCGYSPQQNNLLINHTSFTFNPSAIVNRILMAKDNRQSVSIDFPASELPVYGVSFESESGVIVDNFSFRGITGVEFNRIDSNFLKAIQQANHYDLIILQYGVNLLFKPNEKNFRPYQKSISNVVGKFKNCFKDADILIVSGADRAFRYGQEYKTAIGLDSLIKIQAELAFRNEAAFFNLYETMGGPNSIVNWARVSPPLANKDYVHPNGRGAAILGSRLFLSFKREYDKYLKTTAKNNHE